MSARDEELFGTLYGNASGSSGVTLKELSTFFLASGAESLPAVPITGITADPGRVHPGTLYVALTSDGIGAAVHRGAVAVVVEQFPHRDPGVPVLLVQDARRALGHLLDRVHGRPSRGVAVCGITGSLGRGTTARLLEAALRGSGRTPSRILLRGTADGAEQVQRRLAHALAAGRSACALSLAAKDIRDGRIEGVHFRAAIATGFVARRHRGPGGAEAAFEATAELLRGLARDAVAILPVDDPAYEVLLAETSARVLGYGFAADADIRGRVLRMDESGSVLSVRTPFGTRQLETPLVGRGILGRMLAALAGALALGADPDRAIDGLAALQALPGRLEKVLARKGVVVRLQDAATETELAAALDDLRPLVRGRLHVVLAGQPGRCAATRARVARLVERASDRIVVTSDGVPCEHPMTAARDLLRGLAEPRRALLEPERGAAIGLALDGATAGDTVLVVRTLRPGSGQDDRELARRALAARFTERS